MGKSLQARAKKSTDQKIGSFIAVICLVVLYVFLFLLDNALPSNSTTIMLVTVLKKGAIYALVCVSMNLLNGFTGLFSLGQAGFMLIGAYTYAIFTIPVEAKEKVYQYYDCIIGFSLPIPVALVLAGLLAAVFAVFLILFAGRTGLRAIVSFVLTVLMLWKVLVPLYLKGYNPIWIGLAITLFLTVLIIALVYGFDRRCWAAVSGSFLGILVTCVLGILFTDLFQIHGAVMSYSESLLYSGYAHLSLTQIFMAAIFIGASGAIMDLSVDITSAVYEVVEKRPDLSWREAARSGMNVGRSAMGTMTTTLLLAYSGGYVALLMVFMAQGTPVENILNYKYVASELIHTVVGSIGLVTVAPFTALSAGFLLTRPSFPGKVVDKTGN